MVELFAGRGNLSRALAKRGVEVIAMDEWSNDVVTGLDLLKQDHYKAIRTLIKKRRIRWLHI